MLHAVIDLLELFSAEQQVTITEPQSQHHSTGEYSNTYFNFLRCQKLIKKLPKFC